MEALLLPKRRIVLEGESNAWVARGDHVPGGVGQMPDLPDGMIGRFSRAEKHVRIGKILEEHIEHSLGLQDVL